VPLEREQSFVIMRGGAISMVSKNWKLFVALLSGFWLGKMLLGRPEKENVSRQNKQMKGRKGQTP
jgi:hypothetical protein